MDDHLADRWRRWAEAEAAGHDDEADEMFGEVWRDAAPKPPPSPLFATRAMEAITAEALRQSARSARLRRAAAAAAVLLAAATAWFGAGYAVAGARSLLVALFNFSIGTVVRAASGAQTGADLWSFLGSLGYAASAFVADPRVTFVLLVLQGLALAALVALQRLLGSDGESWK